MKNKMAVETKLEELKDRYWLYYEKEDGTPKFIINDEDAKVAAELWHISPEAVKALSESIDNAIGYVVDIAVEDLKDVWELSRCAHDNALTAMAILNENDEDCNGDDFDWEDCGDCKDKDDCSDYQNHLKDDLSNSRVN
jgi:hypothetical protein